MDARLDDLDALVKGATREELPELVGRLAQLQALALARLIQPIASPPVVESDRLLNVEQASAISGLSVRQLKSRKLPFARRIGHRTRMYSALGDRAVVAPVLIDRPPVPL